MSDFTTAQAMTLIRASLPGWLAEVAETRTFRHDKEQVHYTVSLGRSARVFPSEVNTSGDSLAKITRQAIDMARVLCEDAELVSMTVQMKYAAERAVASA